MAKSARKGLASLTLLDIAAGVAVVAAGAMPAAAQGAPSWTGFYIGAHAGYRWADATFTGSGYGFDPDGPGGISLITIPARSEDYNLDGGIYGIQSGYNYQFAPNYLIGIEGDWSWGSAKDSKSATLNVLALDGTTYRLRNTSEAELGWQATIRARFGVIQGPWMFFGTGGAGFIRATWSDTTVLSTTGGLTRASNAGSIGKTLSGFVVGGGTEYMYSPNWIVRIEYLYESFGSFDAPYGVGTRTGKLDISDVQKVRVGISFKIP